MVTEKIKILLRQLTKHDYIEIVLRGNSAIKSALSIFPKNSMVLIPEEGAWLSYKTIPKELGLRVEEVKCNDSKINLKNLQEELSSKKIMAILYQNPGGYFVEQPMEEIYEICKKRNCLVIVDVSGAIGTQLCDGNYADILVGSFGKWKLIDAKVGGFISCTDKKLFGKIGFMEKLEDHEKLKIILKKINNLGKRIIFLSEKREKIIGDLKEYEIIYPHDAGLVAIVKFTTDSEKEKIINYCQNSGLEWTEGPRSIRINTKAICIEVKRLKL